MIKAQNFINKFSGAIKGTAPFKALKFHRRQKVTGRRVARAFVSGDRFEVNLGEISFFVKPGHPIDYEVHCFDFAVFGLAALSMSNGWEIDFESPVSESVVARVEEIRRTYDDWMIIGLYPLRLHFSCIVSDPDLPARTSIGICMSGGIDSLAGAIEAQSKYRLSHGVLIAGADYPNSHHPGFLELLQRVKFQADALGIRLLVCETNIRSLGFNWEMLFGLNLAMCLHAQSAIMCAGGIGGDFTMAQDMILHPWGTSHALNGILSTDNFEVLSLNKELGRTEKLSVIFNHSSRLIPLLSVCWRDRSTGKNCGKCLKCQRTMLNSIAAFGFVPDIFNASPDLETFIKNLKAPKRFSAVRTELIQIGNIYHNMPEGNLKRLLSVHLNDLRLAYLKGMPRP